MAEPNDVFEQLLSVKWRDIEFPITRSKMTIAHDLVEHKYWGVDGARVESTGLAPHRFTFTAPLLNTIAPGRNEKWAALYPNQMRLLVAAFQLKTAGMLQHMEYGLVLCKAERMEIDWDASRRGGVDAELSFVQTTVAEVELENDTPVQVVDIGAIDLNSDATKANLKALLLAAGVGLPPYLVDPTIDLEGMANKIKAVADTVTVASYRAAGQIDALEYQIDRIAQSVDAAKSAQTWPITQNIERMKAAMHDLHENLLAQNKNIALFKVPGDTTLAGVVQQLPQAKVSDVIKLNPALMRGPVVPKGTIVRYYRTG